MTDTFSFARFGLLLRKHLIEEYKQYLLLSAGILGILLVFNGLTTISGVRVNAQYDSKMPEVSFIMGFILGGCIFASLVYNFFQNTAKGIRFLQLPASHLEKTAIIFVITQVAFCIVFIVLFYINNWLMCTIYNTFISIPANVPPQRLQFFHAELFDIGSGSAKQAIVLFFVLSAICHFGSLVFQKTAFIKIGLCIIIVAAIMNWFNYTFMRSIIPESSMPGGMFFNNSIRLGNDQGIRGFVLLPDAWINAVNYILPGVLYVFFWLAGYYKLKEKQV